MKIQEYVADSIGSAAEEFFRYAKATPADKVGWVPMEGGRTVISMCQEVAKCCDWAFELISSDKMPEFNEEIMAEQHKEMATWETVEKCEAIFAEKYAPLVKLYKETPDAKLSDTKWLPFNGGRDHTILEMMEYPRWNINYHTGQIAYIQTLFGDKEMH